MNKKYTSSKPSTPSRLAGPCCSLFGNLLAALRGELCCKKCWRSTVGLSVFCRRHTDEILQDSDNGLNEDNEILNVTYRRLHVLPVGDTGPWQGIHAAHEDCWCHPLADGSVVLHHAHDCRPMTGSVPWALMVNPDYLNGRGLFSRPEHKGYTMDWREAGRFSYEEAKQQEKRSSGKYTAIPLPIIPRLALRQITPNTLNL